LKETEFNDSVNGMYLTQSLLNAQQSDDFNNENLSESGAHWINVCKYERNENEMRPDVISHAINGSHSQSSGKPDIISIQESMSYGCRKPLVTRTVSLGSGSSGSDSTYRQSGRFSVSPVNLDIEPQNSSLLDTNNPLVEIKAETSIEETIDTNEEKSDKNESTNEDILMELPTNLNKNSTFLLPESPINRTFRRMSTPSLSLTAKPKPRPLREFKICTNLESLDLKSSLPVSPTFFARFGEF